MTVEGNELNVCKPPTRIIQAYRPLDQGSWQRSHPAFLFHLSEDLIIHEQLKSFQFIRLLSCDSHVGSMKNMVMHGFIKVNRLHIVFHLEAFQLTRQD